jgi:chorismate synthase
MISFANEEMKSEEYDELKDTPRPGHADLVARQKYGDFADLRGGGHFSGRLTLPLVAAGVIAKRLIEPATVKAEVSYVAGQEVYEDVIEDALKDGDSVGGILQCTTMGLPPGLGEPFFDSVESVLSHAVFSIPGIKGIEFGVGFKCAHMRGSEFNDEILDKNGRTATNSSGGINGGLTNSNPLMFQVAVRPAASISKEQKTVNLKTGKQVPLKVEGRHDACIAAVTAIVLADLKMIEQKIPRVLE